MPIYEYNCVLCGRVIEQINKREVVLIKCNFCGGNAYKIISPCNVHYKGKGFYTTDKEGDNK